MQENGGHRVLTGETRIRTYMMMGSSSGGGRGKRGTTRDRWIQQAGGWWVVGSGLCGPPTPERDEPPRPIPSCLILYISHTRIAHRGLRGEVNREVNVFCAEKKCYCLFIIIIIIFYFQCANVRR